MESWNCWVVLTLIAMAAGEIVTLILVAESVQVSVELEAEVLALVLVQVMVVVVGAWLQEASPTRVIKETNNARRFTAPLSSPFQISKSIASVSILVPKK